MTVHTQFTDTAQLAPLSQASTLQLDRRSLRTYSNQPQPRNVVPDSQRVISWNESCPRFIARLITRSKLTCYDMGQTLHSQKAPQGLAFFFFPPQGPMAAQSTPSQVSSLVAALLRLRGRNCWLQTPDAPLLGRQQVKRMKGGGHDLLRVVLVPYFLAIF
jgi:hypothetical protein